MSVSKDRLRALLDERFGVPAADITDEATFEELALDSLILVEFALVVRKEFGIALDSWELEPSFTVKDAAELVDAKAALV
ncbi:acyl carrier protein [Krasilnikovia sp. M28-CT-15]|uniref:acyl carrier protein n=1 Tax=Krasilnikovia sp. M28-CT-15 TaxID=3373540 RepID=UPI003875F378